MSDELFPVSGHCLCGAVSISLDARPEVDACHCDMCRRWGGIAFVDIAGENIVIEGRENIENYRSSEWAERGFCKTCGSHIYFHYLPGDRHAFPAGLFKGIEDFPMTEQIFIDEKPAYYDFSQDTPRLTGPEAKAKFGFDETK